MGEATASGPVVSADGRSDTGAWWSRAKPKRWVRGQDAEGGPSLAANRLMDSLVNAAADGIGMGRSDAERIKCRKHESLCEIVRLYWLGSMSAREAIEQTRIMLRHAAAE